MLATEVLPIKEELFTDPLRKKMRPDSLTGDPAPTPFDASMIRNLELEAVKELFQDYDLRETEEVACVICGKHYKSKVCVKKHLWEHSVYWDMFDGLKKQQRVLSIQAAIILSIKFNPSLSLLLVTNSSSKKKTSEKNTEKNNQRKRKLSSNSNSDTPKTPTITDVPQDEFLYAPPSPVYSPASPRNDLVYTSPVDDMYAIPPRDELLHTVIPPRDHFITSNFSQNNSSTSNFSQNFDSENPDLTENINISNSFVNIPGTYRNSANFNYNSENFRNTGYLPSTTTTSSNSRFNCL